jgi:hypothetical protein
LPTDATSQQEFSDADWRVVATGDQSKKAKFDLSNLTTATTRVITMPDADLTLWGSVSPTFTGTLTGPTLRLTTTGDASLSSTGHAFQIGDAGSTNVIIDNNEIMARNNGAASFFGINSDGGNVRIGGTGSVVEIAGGQASFPATQAPSSDANTLDDYERGTWTPVLNFGGATTGITYSATRFGTYTKFGRGVVVNFNFILTSKGSATGAATVSGLPFECGDARSTTAAYLNAGGYSGLTAGAILLLQAAATVLDMRSNTTTGTANTSDTAFGSTSQLGGGVAYVAAA